MFRFHLVSSLCLFIADTGHTVHLSTGMSLRDYFAAAAMQGDMAAQGYFDNTGETAKHYAERAYEIADAMIKQREEAK
jgi:hypothetical protein